MYTQLCIAKIEHEARQMIPPLSRMLVGTFRRVYSLAELRYLEEEFALIDEMLDEYGTDSLLDVFGTP
mgnify:CR=1 FL=1